jgi:hypothetical protein
MSSDISKLKILVIDDNPPEIDAELQERFEVKVADSPAAVGHILRRCRPQLHSSYNSSAQYQLAEFPFDGYLADFNLSGAATGTVEPDIQSSVPILSHRQVPGYTENSAAAAVPALSDLRSRGLQAAGLLTAAIAALNAPTHPAVILPYTAFTQQRESGTYAMLEVMSEPEPDGSSIHGDLVRQLSPSTLVWGFGNERALGQKDLSEKLQSLSSAYRNNLPGWIHDGILDVPFGERERLETLVKERVSNPAEAEQADMRVHWESDDHIILYSAYGRRRILCSSLWYTQDSVDPSFVSVGHWLKKFPVPTADYVIAAGLAHEYLAYGMSDAASRRYELSRLVRKYSANPDDLEAQSHSASIKELCAVFGLEFSSVVSDPKEQHVPLHRPHLLAKEFASITDDKIHEDNVKRLAVYMLLAAIQTFRHEAVRETTDVFKLESRISDIINESKTSTRQWVSELRKQATSTYASSVSTSPLEDSHFHQQLLSIAEQLLRADLVPRMVEGSAFRLDERSPLEDLAFFIDPLPLQLLTETETDWWDQRIGAALRRLGLKKQKLLALVEGTCDLDLAERRAVRSFMEGFDAPAEAWPNWIRGI